MRLGKRICTLLVTFGTAIILGGCTSGLDTAGTLNIDSTPLEATNSSDGTFDFSGCDYGGYECSLDGAEFETCTSPATYTDVSEGTHTFEVRCGDTTETDSYSWTVDLTAPDTTISSGPNDPINSTDAAFTFTSDDSSATFECRMDDGGYSSCESGTSYSGLAEGQHTFYVRASDAAGNTDETPASFTWEIDLTEPNTTINNPPLNVGDGEPITFEFACDDTPCTFECQVCDNPLGLPQECGAYASCQSGVQYIYPGGMSHTFNVRATDEAGNTETTPATHTWFVIGFE